MTDREQILGQPCLHLRMQIEQAHGIGDGGATTADLMGNILLSQAELAGQAGVTLCLLDCIEISALQVFYQRELQDIAVASEAQDYRHLNEAELPGSAPTAFARDELVSSIHCPNYQGLNDSVLPDGFD